jgi:hypothetical protein
MAYAERHCLIEHVIYLAVTSGLKVGVTRNTQVPTRWIDQGAVRVVELARTPNRFEAGRIEVMLKEKVNDKTAWRQMLTGPGPRGIDLQVEKERVGRLLPGEFGKYLVKENKIMEIAYPVTKYPEKVRSLNLDKGPVVKGVLSGIKGQYLMFNDQSVINLRKYGGYLVRLQFD